MPLAALAILLVGLLAVPRPWAARTLQVVLAVAVIEWILTTVGLAQLRLRHDEPYVRLAVILGSVTLFTALAAVGVPAPVAAGVLRAGLEASDRVRDALNGGWPRRGVADTGWGRQSGEVILAPPCPKHAPTEGQTQSMKTLLATAGACALLTLATVDAADMKSTDTSAAPANVLLAPWKGPYGGIPPFDKVKVADLQPALEAAMTQQLAEIDRIANDPAAPTFENTIAAMERTGRTLDRVATVYGIYSSTLNDDAVQAVEREMAPKLAAFSDQITQNQPLFERIAKVYDTRETAGLTPEQQRLTWVYYTNFVRAGAKLDAAAKKRTAEINQELAKLFTTFGQNVLKDENDGVIYIDKEADLAGLPQGVRDGMAQGAEGRGQKGKWAIANTRSSVEPFLTYSDNRALREQVWRMFVNRGDNGGATDNNAIITQILQLRAERAKLLGFPTHAHWRLENTMAKTPERAMELMEAVWTPAVARVHEEVADMQKIADDEKAGIKIEPWDYRYYAEKVRKAKYDLDETQITPYMQLENLREGMFYMARELFGFSFKPVDAAKVPVYHPDVRVWEVTDPQGEARRPLVLRPVRTQGQAFGRVDERLPQPGALRRRRQDDRFEQLELREGQARRAGADQLGGRHARCSTNSATRCTA